VTGSDTATRPAAKPDALLDREISHWSCPYCYPSDTTVVPGEVAYCGALLGLDNGHVCPLDNSCGCIECRLCIEVDVCPLCGRSDDAYYWSSA
jgi:hypothetical protein